MVSRPHPRSTFKANMFQLFANLQIDDSSLYQGHYDENDFCILEKDGDVSISLCQIRGLRNHQEDILSYSALAAILFKRLPESFRNTVLTQLFHSLQEQYGKMASVGSTACASFAWLEETANKKILHAWNVNVGDSSAALVILSPAKTTYNIIYLNELHNADATKNINEFQRINKLAIPNTQHRLDLSRALGDTNLEALGLLHAPEIKEYINEIEAEDAKIFLITFSDGIPTAMKNDLGNIICDLHTKPLHLIAANLTKCAFFDFASEDNISVSITEVTKNPISTVIFDGHGGSQVVQQLHKHFYPLLEKIIFDAYPRANINKAIDDLQRNNWPEIVKILVEATPTEYLYLNDFILKLLNQNRENLTKLFIDYVGKIDPMRQLPVLNEVLAQKNGLGILLNTPVNNITYFFTRHYHDNHKITGSINTIRIAFKKILEEQHDYTELTPSPRSSFC